MLVYICKSDGKSYYTYFGRLESLYDVFYKTLQTYVIYALLSDMWIISKRVKLLNGVKQHRLIY